MTSLSGVQPTILLRQRRAGRNNTLVADGACGLMDPSPFDSMSGGTTSDLVPDRASMSVRGPATSRVRDASHAFALSACLGLFFALFIASHSAIAQTVFWSSFGEGRLQRASHDGEAVSDGFIKGLASPRHMAVDLESGHIYWAAPSGIQRAAFDGSGVIDLVSDAGLPIAVAVDSTNGHIYWTDATGKKIRRAALDGSQVTDIISGLDSPDGIAIDVANQTIYWADNSAGKIQRVNFDGTGVADVIVRSPEDSSSRPEGVALDLQAGQVYWTDTGLRNIQRANLDGSNVVELVKFEESGFPNGIVLDVNNQKMYWANDGDNKIQRANLDGSEIADVATLRSSPIGNSARPAGFLASCQMGWRERRLVRCYSLEHKSCCARQWSRGSRVRCRH